MSVYHTHKYLKLTFPNVEGQARLFHGELSVPDGLDGEHAVEVYHAVGQMVLLGNLHPGPIVRCERCSFWQGQHLHSALSADLTSVTVEER